MAWGALLAWLFLIERSKPKGAFFYSVLIGLLFFGGTIWWVSYPALVVAPLVIAILALYLGCWGWMAQRIMVKDEGSGVKGKTTALHPAPYTVLFGLPAAWVLLEVIRSFFPFSGFGWNLLAHTQWNRIPLIQLADLTGAYGISFLVVMVNVALWQALRTRRVVPLALTGLLLFAVLVYGSFRLRAIDQAMAKAPAFKVAVVQGNVPQYQKWDQAYKEKIWERYETLTQEAAQQDPDLIVWPETAVPDFLGEIGVSDRLSRLAWSFQTPLLVGAPVVEWAASSTLFNSAVLFGSEGEILERYDKIHLVPFGEFVPFRRWFGWLYRYFTIGEFTPGQEFTVFEAPLGRGRATVPFSVLICFEDLFLPLSRRFLQEGAQVLFVITNDAWFKRSAGSLQHLQTSVFRAVEGHVWVARAANTGWSGFIDPAGRRKPAPHQVPRFEKGIATATLRTPVISTLQTGFGGWFEILCAGWVGLTFLRMRRYNKRS